MIFRRKYLAAFEKEAVPHMDALFRMAFSLARDRQLAEDLVQETFRQAWSSFGNYEQGTDCKAWLFRILFRVRNRDQRRRQRFRWVDIEELPEGSLAQAPSAEERLQGIEAEALIRDLPGHYATAMILADAEGLSYREVARILDVPIGTVMSRLNRGRKMIRERIGGGGRSADGGRGN